MAPFAAPFLADFVAAQAGGVWDRALAELRAGAKRTHWMWFIFPRIAGLGRSPIARRFALPGRDAARAYLAHPTLGARLCTATDAMLGWAGNRSAEAILGATDAQKFRSSMTLFDAASVGGGGGERGGERGGRAPFAAALAGFYGGERDPLTLERL